MMISPSRGEHLKWKMDIKFILSVIQNILQSEEERLNKHYDVGPQWMNEEYSEIRLCKIFWGIK